MPIPDDLPVYLDPTMTKADADRDVPCATFRFSASRLSSQDGDEYCLAKTMLFWKSHSRDCGRSHVDWIHHPCHMLLRHQCSSSSIKKIIAELLVQCRQFPCLRLIRCHVLHV